MEKGEITRTEVLAEMDIREKPDGTKRFFSMKFVGFKNGKIYFIPKAYACGAGKMNMKQMRKRGIQPCDCNGNPEGHIYPVDIDLILEYNGQIVKM